MIDQNQEEVCKKTGSAVTPPQPGSMVGISKNLLDKGAPINGLRHLPKAQSNGWYLWTDEDVPSDPDFFHPIHVEHIYEKFPEAAKYLALEPGFRIQFDLRGYEDIWRDEALLLE